MYKYYIIHNGKDTIFGFGRSLSEARKEATGFGEDYSDNTAAWPDRVKQSKEYRPGNSKEKTGQLWHNECTEDLYEMVTTLGGDIPWEYEGNIACLPEGWDE